AAVGGEGSQLARRRPGRRVWGHGKGSLLQVARGATGGEFAVARPEDLVLGGPIGVQLRDDQGAVDGAAGAGYGLADGRDGDFLKGGPWGVLGAVDVADLGPGRHDHRGRAVPAGKPAALVGVVGNGL